MRKLAVNVKEDKCTGWYWESIMGWVETVPREPSEHCRVRRQNARDVLPPATRQAAQQLSDGGGDL